MKNSSTKVRFKVTLLLVVVLLSACSDNPERMLASAKDFLGKNDSKAAVIQLKNALQAQPKMPEARFLLGKALLQGGDPGGAETELRKARDLKYSDDAVVPLLAHAMLAQGQARKVTDEFSKTRLTQSEAKADLLTSVASAWAVQGKATPFQEALDAALESQPGYAPALVAQARAMAAQKDFDGALKMVENVLTKDPKSAEALKLKGDILYYAKSLPDQGLANYRLAVQAKPGFVAAHAGVINVLLQQGKLDEATVAVDTLEKIAGGQPQTLYLQGLLAYQKRDFKTAREDALQLLRMAPENSRALQLAGAIDFQLNSLLQAESHLAKAVQAGPELSLARRLLVLTYLRTGQMARALATLPDDLATNDSDVDMLSVAGQVYLQSGDVAKAQAYFSRASKLDPNDSRKRTELAVTHLMTGQSDLGFGELRDIAAVDKGITADMALISAHLQLKEFEQALKAIDGLERKQPDDPQVAILRGRTLLAQQNSAAARKSFDRALALDPKFFPAIASLAAMDVTDKKPQDAKKRFEALLENDPKNEQALLALAELATRNGAAKGEVAALLGKAIEANPTEPEAHNLLIEFYLRDKDATQAVAAAQRAVAALPANPDVLDMLGRAQAAAGETNQAITTYTRLSAMLPQSPEPTLRLAGVYLAAKDPKSAAQSLRRALEIKPDLLAAQRGLAGLAMLENKSPEALGVSRDIQKQRPKEADGYLLEGDIHAALKEWAPAAETYRAGLKQVASPELAIRLHSALIAGGKTTEADKFAAEWQKDHAKDAAFAFYLGDRATVSNNLALAEKQYLQVLKLQPNSAVVHNNLAWVTGKLGKDGAMAYAEKANALAPNQPALMDTLAMLSSDRGDSVKALALQKKVVAMQPDAAVYKLNLAKIQIKAGDKSGAKTTLDELATLGAKFGGQAEVAKLKAGL